MTSARGSEPAPGAAPGAGARIRRPHGERRATCVWDGPPPARSGSIEWRGAAGLVAFPPKAERSLRRAPRRPRHGATTPRARSLPMALLDPLDDFSMSCSDTDCDLAFGDFGGFAAGEGGFFLPSAGGPLSSLPPPPPPRRRRRTAGDADAGKSRGNYNCSKCGQPKRGHGACASRLRADLCSRGFAQQRGWAWRRAAGRLFARELTTLARRSLQCASSATVRAWSTTRRCVAMSHVRCRCLPSVKRGPRCRAVRDGVRPRSARPATRRLKARALTCVLRRARPTAATRLRLQHATCTSGRVH